MTPLVKTLAKGIGQRMLRCAKAANSERGTMKQRIVCFGELLLRLSAPGRERLLRQARYRNLQTDEIVSVDPDQLYRLKRI